MVSLLFSVITNAAVLNIPFAAVYLGLFLLKALFYWCPAACLLANGCTGALLHAVILAC